MQKSKMEFEDIRSPLLAAGISSLKVSLLEIGIYFLEIKLTG